MRYLIILSLVVLLTACGTAPGQLEVTTFDHPDTVDVSSEKEITFTFSVENIGEKSCTVQNIYSPDFWKVDNPGASGNANIDFDTVLSPGEKQIFVVPVHVWDSDAIQDHMKRFAFTLNIEYNDDCPQAFITKEGLIWLYK